MRFICGILFLVLYHFPCNIFAQTPDSTKVISPDTLTNKTEATHPATDASIVTTPVTNTKPDTTNKATKDTSGFNFFFNEEEEIKFLDYKPIISLGGGMLSFYGEGVGTPRSHPIIGRFGYNIGVSKNISDYVSIGLATTIGKLSGMYKSPEKNFNFQSDIFCGGVNVVYNFGNMLKKEGYLTAITKQYEVLPFVSIGVEVVNYSSKGDIKDKNGNTYYYWADGTVRNVPENDPKAGMSVILQRDYKYETDLRELNLDKIGRYSESTLAVPITIGADFIVHDKVTLRVSTSLHYTFSDNLDNISSKGTGVRHGNKGMDAFMYSNISFLFDIFSSEKIVNYDQFSASNPNMSNFDKIYYADEDKDGVNDFDDNCIGTPLGIAIDKHGCPIDCDGDGIPDYLDKEYNTPKGTVVDLEGNPYSEEMLNKVAADSATVGVDYDMILKYYPSLASTTKSFESFADEIPTRYKYIDANEDGFLSLDEFYNELDRFFDGKSKLTIEQIYELMDFFFSQEK